MPTGKTGPWRRKRSEWYVREDVDMLLDDEKGVCESIHGGIRGRVTERERGRVREGKRWREREREVGRK